MPKNKDREASMYDGMKERKPLAITKCKEGSKEYLRERTAKQPYSRCVLVCEYRIMGIADGQVMWRLAKKAAREFLRVSWMDEAIVMVTMVKGEPFISVYGRY